MGRKYRLLTLGCKVNQYESQILRETLEAEGFRPASQSEKADLAIVNTCAVTHSALRQSKGEVRRLARNQPVIVVGCGASADPEQFRRIEGVCAVLGHDVEVSRELRSLVPKLALGALSSIGDDDLHHRGSADRNDGWRTSGGSKSARRRTVAHHLTLPIISHDPQPVKPAAELVSRIEAFAGHHRAFLKVQDGCDAFCTYCIIPRLRPAVRSKPIEIAVAEAAGLVRAGYKEIVLTGVFLGAYGHDTAIRRRWSMRPQPLAELVRTLSRVPGLQRLRLSSLEPGDVTDELLEVLAISTVCVPHLHLPLQSGSPRILRAMNRQYTQQEFLDMIARVRRRLDRPAITTDIIVGFPGETERDFEETLAVARTAEFLKIHAFPFSPRAGTAAARWSKQFISRSVVRERMRFLAELEADCSLRFRTTLLGCNERVLIERCRKVGESIVASGHVDRYFETSLLADATIEPGTVIPVTIVCTTRTQTWSSPEKAGHHQIPLAVV